MLAERRSRRLHHRALRAVARELDHVIGSSASTAPPRSRRAHVEAAEGRIARALAEIARALRNAR
jgi:hypothetical protein